MSLTAAELFPELATQSAISDLLAPLNSSPVELFGELLDEAGPLLPENRRHEATALRDELLSQLADSEDGGKPFTPFLIHTAAGELLKAADHLNEKPIVGLVEAEQVLLQLAQDVSTQLRELALRTLVVALRQHAAAGTLSGTSPEERYQSFLEHSLTDTFAESLSEEFTLLIPVLRRAARRTCQHTVDVLRHLASDLPQLAALGLRPGDRVKQVSYAASDRHRGGRAVTILRFSSGRTIVHKPRSLVIDRTFQEFITKVNDWAGTDLRTCGVVAPREADADHGWMEFIETGNATSADRLGYFERVGQLTAVLYLMNGHDMHHSNVVFDGTGPVAIDLESLMQPGPLIDAGGKTNSDAGALTAQQVLQDSVQSIGILPMRVSNGSGGSVDLGGIGYEDGHLSPFKSLVVKNRGRDDMSLALEQVVLRDREHAPTLHEDSPDVPDAAAALDRGFTMVWDAVAEHRDEAIELLQTRARNAQVRYIHNPTVWYAQLLRLASGPRFVADPANRTLALQRVALSRSEADPRLAQAELRDLAAGDVPYFSAETTGRILRDGSGQVVGTLLPSTPLERVVERLSTMTSSGRDLQRRMLSLTLVGKLPRAADRTELRSPQLLHAIKPGSAQPDRTKALALACQIGDELVRTQLRGEDDGPATWIDPIIGATREEDAWFPGVIGHQLYQGTLGPAIFLAELSRLCGNDRYATASLDVLGPLATRWLTAEANAADGTQRTQPVGAYAGLAGIPYALATAGTALNHDGLIAQAVQILARLHLHLGDDRTYDLISGAGGVLAVALAVTDRLSPGSQRDTCLDLARAAAGHLAQHHSWGDPDTDKVLAKGYSGFGHGTAGLSPYLYRLAAHDRQIDPIKARLWALAAERNAAHTRSHFDPESGDWTNDAGRERRSYGWCHGAPGIALSHVQLIERGLASAGDHEPELRAAATQITRRGLGNNLTYCHGDLGNVEVFQRLAASLRDDALSDLSDQLAARLIEDTIPHHLASANSRYRHTSCLMLGTSGVGHFLLRQIDPAGVPSVLTLD